MKLDRSRAILKEGTELTLVAEILPEASSRSLDWTSSDTKVATVDAHGRVKALTKGEIIIIIFISFCSCAFISDIFIFFQSTFP